MDDAERAFRDALHRVDSVKIPVPSLEPAQVTRGPGLGVLMSRWLAAAAVLAVVAGLSVWVFAGRGQPVAGIPAARPTPTPATVVLTGTTWMAVELFGTPTKPAPEKVPFLEFSDNATFYGGDPCNQFKGTYLLHGGGLTLGTTAKSELGCNVAQQQRFDKALTDTRRVQRSGDTIELLDQTGVVVARFRSSVSFTEQPPRGPLEVTPSPTAGTPTQEPDATPTMINRPAPAVWVRIRNASGVDFEQVQVNFYDKRVDYGDIKAGAQSRYLHTLLAYRYAFVQLTAAGKQYRLRPVDYVGETELASGRYTYVLDLDGTRISLRLEVEK